MNGEGQLFFGKVGQRARIRGSSKRSWGGGVLPPFPCPPP